jgi:hypothetical protein
MTFPSLDIPLPPSVGAADPRVTPNAQIDIESCEGDGR